MKKKLNAPVTLLAILFISFFWQIKAYAETLEVRVNHRDDDAEEHSNGHMSLSSSDLELTRDRSTQKIGIRFKSITIPKNSTITNAYIEFTVDESDSRATQLTIKGEAHDNAPTFRSSNNNISQRNKTTQSKNWNPDRWRYRRNKKKTPNLNHIVQEIIDREGWDTGSAIAFIITGTGKRVAYSYNGSSSKAPLLHIEYTAPNPDDNTLIETITLSGTLRDFHANHPDFQLYDDIGNWSFAGLVPNMVKNTLGSDKKPIFNGTSKSTSTANNFNQWFKNTPDINQSKPYSITLEKNNQGNYEYDSANNPAGNNNNPRGFFPLDGELFGNEGNIHNYHITYELHHQFTYQGGETFAFSGDDDVWVFINNQLVVDIGGVHSAIHDSINLDNLNLTLGETYNFDMFWAERQTIASNFKIETSIKLEDVTPPPNEDSQCTALFADDFESGLSDKWRTLKASGGFTPQVVNGRLRLTNREHNLSTAVTLDYVFPSNENKFTIEFDYYAYGGCANGSNHRGSNNAGDWGADGISIALFDSSVGASPRVGGNGGSLGYANKTNQLGFEKGWLGVGIDEYGNFENNDEGRRDINGRTYNYISEEPNTIAIRGNEASGYRLLASTTALGEALAQLTNESYKSGRYRFTADMFSNGFQEITLERNTGSGYTTLIGPFNGLDSTYHQGGVPEKFRIALSSGTGGACNIHEIDNLKICSKGEEYTTNVITSCETGFFQHLQKRGQKHEFGKLNIETQTYDKVFSFDEAELNAFGYSVTDNVFYGTSTKRGDYALYRLKLNGELEKVTTLPTDIYAGDVDANNIWYGFKGNKVYTVDLTNNPSSYLRETTKNSVSLQAVDFAFKKSNGKFYGAKGTGNNSNKIHKLYIYDPSDNSVSSKVLTGDIETSGNGGTYGASWTDVNGSIYIGNNATGKIHWVDLNTWNTVEVAQGLSGLRKNDGASCAEAPAPFEFDYGDAPVSYGLSPHLIPTDNSPSVYLGATAPDAEVIEEASYPYTTGEATGDNDNQTNDEDGVANFQNKVLVADQIYSIDVTTHGAGGYLHAWIDWNGNGIFENDTIEHVAATNIINNTSGTTNLNIIVPPSAVSGVTYARFRYSTTENLTPTTLANDGEVEDYTVVIEGGVNVCSIDAVPSSIYSTAAVAINLKRLDSSTRVFQTQFNNATWEGYLLSYDLDLTNNNGNTKSQKWNAADNIQYTDREVFSYNPKATTSNKGISLWWNNLNTSQQNAFKLGTSGSDDNKTVIGQKRMRWIRGEQDHEKTPSNTAGILRPRKVLLGDIIHSSPIFSGQRENFGYTSLTADQGGSKYPDFLTAKQSRQAALFVGANDGMLHAFNANTGEELFGFVPNEVIPNLASLTLLKYGCKDEEDCIPHQYYVDGTPAIGDAYFNETWHTVLVGTLGKGGKGIFALDITNPDPNTNPDVSLANFDQNKILWEISATQASNSASTYQDHMGYSTPHSAIVRLNNGKWAAIISNGPESALGTAMLFIIDISNGELIKAINTVGSVDSPNGLSSPIAVDINNDRTADLVYAGDLQGNMWKFDLSSTDSDNWGVAYAEGDTPKPLFTTCESADETPCTKTQAITAKPEVGHHPTGGYMIYFGTGQYFDVSDNVMSASPDVHSLYGIRDNDAPIANFADLVAHTILQESIIPETNNDLKARITSDEVVDLTTKKGWYIRLVAPNNTKEGERVIAKALLREKRLIITTLIPPRNDCALGGGSWITELNAIDGNPLDFPPIDINDDLQFNDQDKVDYQGTSTVVSALQKISLGMILSSPEIINHTSLSEGKYINGTSGKIGMFRESTSRAIGRQSWRQLR